MENDYQENLEEKIEQDKAIQREKQARQTQRSIMTGNKTKAVISGTNIGGGLGVKLIKGKSGWKKFLIVSAAIGASFFGGLNILVKCFKEDMLFTSMVFVFWVIVVIFLISLIVMVFVISTCETVPGFVSWIAEKLTNVNICPPS